MTNHLKVLYWNIHGIHSRTIGEKNQDSQFIDTISGFDMYASVSYTLTRISLYQDTP